MEKVKDRGCIFFLSFFLYGLYGAPVLGQTLPEYVEAQSQRSSKEQAPQAQQPPAEALSTKLNEVIVTATKLEESVSHTTHAVSVITQEEIEQRQTTDVLDQLRDVPGFNIAQTGSRGGSTTLQSRGGESDYNLVLIDGVKSNLAGGAFNFSGLATLGVNRIEIVRGSQSALYGSDAISSVVQLFTPRGQGAPRAYLRFRGGNNETFEEQVGMSGGTSFYGYNLAVERVDSEGILSKNSDYSNTTIASRFDLDPSDGLQLTATLRYHDSRFHFPTGGAGDRFDPLDPGQFQDNRRLILGTRAVYQPISWWRHKLQLGMLYDWSTFRDSFDGDAFDPFGSFVSNTSQRRLSADYSSDFFLPPVGELLPTFTLGAYVEDEHLNQKSNAAGFIDRVSPSRNAQSFYSQLLLGWRDMLFITSGFRLDHGSMYGTHVNPRVSAAFIIPGLHTKLRGGYSEGLKAPTFVENFGTGSSFFQGNPNLDPEQSKSWEIGAEQPIELAQLAAELSLTYFSTEYKNMIAFVFQDGPDLLNVQRARSRGLEAGARAFLSHGFSVRGSYTYLETKALDAGMGGGTAFVSGKSLVRRPEHVGSFTLNYSRARLNANLHLFLKGHVTDLDFSQDFTSRRVRLGGYTRADLAVAYRLFENRWGIRALTVEGQAKNLFDEDYEEVFGFSSAGATVLVGFRAEF